jgi:hypothetical protein
VEVIEAGSIRKLGGNPPGVPENYMCSNGGLQYTCVAQGNEHSARDR